MPILLDSGPSERGWSYYGDAFRCLKWWALKRHAGFDDRGEALTRGTMIHVGLAQQHAQWMAHQNRQDPRMFYSGEDGMREWSYRHQEGLPFLNQMLECFRRYVAKFPEPPGRRILGVEQEMRGVVGWVEGAWGLWLLASTESIFNRAWRDGAPLPRDVRGFPIKPAALVCPGHPDDGEPILVTRRVDLVIEDTRGAVHVWDHKGKGHEVSKGVVAKYMMDGQWAVTRILARQMYPNLDQVSLNLIQTTDPWKTGRFPVPPSPWRDARFPREIHRMAHLLASLQRDYPDPHDFPMAQHELVCATRYFTCPAMTLCMRGPGNG